MDHIVRNNSWQTGIFSMTIKIFQFE